MRSYRGLRLRGSGFRVWAREFSFQDCRGYLRYFVDASSSVFRDCQASVAQATPVVAVAAAEPASACTIQAARSLAISRLRGPR